MTFAAIPALENDKDILGRWRAKILSPSYDPRPIHAGAKRGAHGRMAMADSTAARTCGPPARASAGDGAVGPRRGIPVTGHKWFFSAPMRHPVSTPQVQASGVGGWRPDGVVGRVLPGTARARGPRRGRGSGWREGAAAAGAGLRRWRRPRWRHGGSCRREQLVTAWRRRLLQAQRKTTPRLLPEAWVTGETPTSAASWSSVGKRARSSPSSARIWRRRCARCVGKVTCGNRSNASSEVEFQELHATMLGENGIRTFIGMAHLTRLDFAIGSAGLMRQALSQAISQGVEPPRVPTLAGRPADHAQRDRRSRGRGRGAHVAGAPASPRPRPLQRQRGRAPAGSESPRPWPSTGPASARPRWRWSGRGRGRAGAPAT